MSNSNNGQGGGAAPSNTGGGAGDDALASFTNFSTDGLDTDTMNLFGSFTNDTTQGGASSMGDMSGLRDTSMSQLAANDLSGFGVDLSALEMGNSAGSGESGGGMDLSAIQLMQLDDVPQANTAAAGGQGVRSNDDAAQMMARLLAAGALTRPTDGSTSVKGAAAIPSAPSTDISGLGQQGLGLSLGSTAPPPPVVSGPQAEKIAKSRASSQSSEDMGDIPLAQLALIQPRASNTAGASQAMPTQGAPHLASQPGMIPQQQPAAAIQPMASAGATALSLSGLDAALGIGATAATQQPTGLPGALHLAQTGSAAMGGALSIGRSEVGIGGLAAGLQQQPVGGPQLLVTATSVVPSAAAPLGSMPAPAALLMEKGTTGVESTVLLSKPPHGQPVNPNLRLDMAQPSSSLGEAPLEVLEEIEAKLCSLLSIASKAIKMLAEPKEVSDFGEDSLGTISNIEPIVADFMRAVAEVQAGLKYQHRMLVAQGISIQTNAAFQSDTAGPERDLATWSDAARLLAHALESSLALSSSSTKAE
ncbi:hypothetical protein GQ54DRAFT_308680 [Martensiomyces pterosporus]|nr:hypothetical protein GQ54DRAFT_308680 [Martensiomyces pterosporus]